MNYGFFALNGHVIKLQEVSYIGPLEVLPVTESNFKKDNSRFNVVISGTGIEFVGERTELSSLRSSLMTALAIQEPIDPTNPQVLTQNPS